VGSIVPRKVAKPSRVARGSRNYDARNSPSGYAESKPQIAKWIIETAPRDRVDNFTLGLHGRRSCLESLSPCGCD
jgi:hypothetical protein